jgi:hypothetical protein
MNYISENHLRISNYLSNREILTNPEKYFGPNYKILLNAWIIQENIITCWDFTKFDPNYAYIEACKVVGSYLALWCSPLSREIIAAHLILAAGKELQAIQSIKVP